jgi:hypothetical protein
MEMYGMSRSLIKDNFIITVVLKCGDIIVHIKGNSGCSIPDDAVIGRGNSVSLENDGVAEISHISGAKGVPIGSIGLEGGSGIGCTRSN